MFNSIGKFFKKMFSSLFAKKKNKTFNSKVVSISDAGRDNFQQRHGSRFTASSEKSNKVKKWRAKNKVARQSRNKQHRIAKAA